MKLKLVSIALVAYMLAIAIAAVTAPSKRLYWPLYLPLVLAGIIALVYSRRN